MPSWKKLVTSGSSPTFNHITSSGNISSSGTLYASAGDFGDGNITNVGTISLDQILPDDGVSIIIGTEDLTSEIEFSGNVTASGNISASGTINVSTFASIQGIDTGNPTPAADETRVSGYGIIGNRSSYYITNANAGSMYFGVGGTHNAATKMTIVSSGNVGIGTTSPSHLLEIDGGTENAFIQLTTPNTKYGGIAFGDPQSATAGRIQYYHGDNSFQFDTDGKFTFEGGNVGIGTTSPPEKLTVAGDISASGATFTGDVTASGDSRAIKLVNSSGNKALQLLSDSSGDGQIRVNNSSGTTKVFLYGENNADGYFNTGGNFGIGTTTPSAKLHLSGSSGDAAESAIRQSRAGKKIWDQAIDSNGRLQWGYRSTEGGSRTVTFTLDDNNNVGIGTGAPGEALEVVGNISASGTIIANAFTGTLTGTATGLAGTPDITVGSLTATSITSSIVTSSILYTEGSNIFGDASDDTHQFTGSILVTGSATIDVGNAGRKIYLTDNSNYANIDADSSLYLGGNAGNIQFRDDAIPESDSSKDLGSTTRYWANLYADNAVVGNITASGNISASGNLIANEITASGTIGIPDYIVHNGDGDTKFGFEGANDYRVHVGGSDRFKIQGDVHVVGTTDFAIPATRKLYLDGQSNTYLSETSADTIKIFTGGSERLKISNTSTEVSHSLNVTGTITASGDISSSGTVTAKDINIGQTLYSSSKNTDIDTGTETVATIATGSYDAAFFDYVAKNGTNLRAGTITAIHNASTVQYSEASTVDIGDTADVKLAVVETGGSLALQATVASDDWSVKTLVRGL